MTFFIIILTGLFYLIPGMAEIICETAESSGNFYIIGAALDVKYKRNFVYITTFSSILFSFTKLKMLQYFFYSLFLFSNYSYYKTIQKYNSLVT
jgi:hypothetical protein